jgi:regulatory protein
MAGTITALKFQQRNQERVSVYLDGEYAFGLAAVEAARLCKGQVLSDAEIAALQAQDERNRAFDQAVRFLSYRPRSRTEVERFLRGKAFPQEATAEAVERLEQAGYLDDAAFARFWVQDREQFKPRSQHALRYELRQKGVSDETIAQALGQLDDEAAAWRAIASRLPRWAGLPREELRQKVAGYLSRRGFDYGTIAVILKQVYQTLDRED